MPANGVSFFEEQEESEMPIERSKKREPAGEAAATIDPERKVASNADLRVAEDSGKAAFFQHGETGEAESRERQADPSPVNPHDGEAAIGNPSPAAVEDGESAMMEEGGAAGERLDTQGNPAR